MCGICGFYRHEPSQGDDTLLRQMGRALAHRGPDDEGYYLCGSLGLGARRLSIIDIPGGRQPMSNEDGSVWIVFNGEIYNYRTLRHELESRGHHLRTQSDTEVIVHLYEEFGERCVERLSGMFAFAIWDEPRRKLLLARDRLGQKPLFYAQTAAGLAFASEVKALLCLPEIERSLDYESLHHYLSLRFIPPPGTMFSGIKKLPPAHYLTYQNGTLRTVRYWELQFQDKLTLTESELLQGLEERLHSAVQSHLVSDAPLGAFLSGGLDSSMVVALMRPLLGGRFKTFAIGVGEQQFDELPFARQVAQHVQTDHVERRVEASLISLLPTIIWHLDEPSDPIAACMYQAAALASQHVKVVLGGDGGDELFAGFDRYLGLSFVNRYALAPSLLRQKVVAPLLQAIPDSYAYKSLTQQLRWVNQLSLQPDAAQRYAEATFFFRFNHAEKQRLFGAALWREVSGANSQEIITRPFQNGHAENIIDRMLYTDYVTRLPEHSLMLTDRMTMAHSLEARSPYLDHELVQYLAAFPSDLKIRKRELKYIMRRLAQRYLPSSIVRRDKQGFMFPVAYWMQSELHNLMQQTLLNGHFVQAGLFQEREVRHLLEEHHQGQRDNHVRLWMLLNLEIWQRLYIENDPIDSITDELEALAASGKKPLAGVPGE